MSGFNSSSGLLSFPDRDSCFNADPSFSGPGCVPTVQMIAFLNISTPKAYLDAYCLNPPDDSCAFGFCPNPDVASPAVRVSTYITTVVSAILILYSPEEVADSLFSQMLNVYSLIIAAIVAVAKRNLTKPHTAVALSLAFSPLSLYLIIYVLRSMIGNSNRLEKVFGRGKWLNRFLVLAIVPIWIALLVFTAKPKGSSHFQQSACDAVVGDHRVLRTFFEPFIVFFEVYPGATGVIFGGWVLSCATAIYLRRREIWDKTDRRNIFVRLWRNVVDSYPFIQFCTVILFPHFLWIIDIEVGILVLLQYETFSFTYGQILACLVTVPPLIQFCMLMPRLYWWFADLTWVRLITCRWDQPRHDEKKGHRMGSSASESTLELPLVSQWSK
ncbi:hypothetical protein GGX14DRAFT_563426 [Mycena pura]|uniref:Uncharacterized protein n=1 Tax=Mycena pura TaxID=153505 RepID=A0AAD6YJ04_9AGAR|nr:hypothetical protein GGX14DRAFT_563426 [Mycena pura]